MTTTRPDSSILTRRQILLGSASLLAMPACRSAARRPATPRDHPGDEVDIDAFVSDCVEANRESEPQAAVREVLERGVRHPGAMLHAVGEPTEAGIHVFHRSPTLTIFAATWTPQMNLMPHNHRMWALIGIYTGREDNIFWRRTPGGLASRDAKCLFEGDVATLHDTAIHSVTNPLRRFTGGIHIYGGDFFATERTQWDPETLEEEPSDGDVIRGIFERENERWRRHDA